MSGLGVKVYTDEDVDVALSSALVERGYDVISTRDAGNAHLGRNDDWQLHYATSLVRAIFTHNIRDFVRHDIAWKARGAEHCGIIVSERVHVGELVRRLASHLDTVSPADQYNTALFLRR